MFGKTNRKIAAHHTHSVVELVGKEVAVEGRDVHISITIADSRSDFLF